jgi:hypothetical protein
LAALQVRLHVAAAALPPRRPSFRAHLLLFPDICVLAILRRILKQDVFHQILIWCLLASLRCTARPSPPSRCHYAAASAAAAASTAPPFHQLVAGCARR